MVFFSSLMQIGIPRKQGSPYKRDMTQVRAKATMS